MSIALLEKPNAETLPKLADLGVLLNGRYLSPPADHDGKLWVRTSALIQVEPDQLYAL